MKSCFPKKTYYVFSEYDRNHGCAAAGNRLSKRLGHFLRQSASLPFGERTGIPYENLICIQRSAPLCRIRRTRRCGRLASRCTQPEKGHGLPCGSAAVPFHHAGSPQPDDLPQGHQRGGGLAQAVLRYLYHRCGQRHLLLAGQPLLLHAGRHVRLLR